MRTETAPPADALHVPEDALIQPGETIAMINQKGGNGKTVTAVTVAARLAALGVPVTLIDADPQKGSATGWLPPEWDEIPEDERYDLVHVLKDEISLDKALWPVAAEGPLSLVPSYKTLKKFESESLPGKDTALRDALEESENTGMVTLIDCPPNLDQITITALVAASAIVIPVKIGGLDFQGVEDLNETLSVVRRRLRKDQRTVAVLTTMVQRSNLTDMITDQLRTDYPEALHSRIRHTVRVGEAPFANEPLTMYAPASTAMQDYAVLTDTLFAPVLAEVKHGA